MDKFTQKEIRYLDNVIKESKIEELRNCTKLQKQRLKKMLILILL